MLLSMASSRRMPTLTLDHIRRHAVARTLFATTLFKAIERLGFIQADPIRAPARAQDLTLRHRVRDYRAGDLERRYPRLAIEEDFFVNYGFLPRATQRLLHPRTTLTARTAWTKTRWAIAHDVLDFVREHGTVHPRQVDAHFQHGKIRNWFGGSSNASTQLLDGMHYRGLLRIARRDSGVRVYAAADLHQLMETDDVAATLDVLVNAIVVKYAPLPEPSLRTLVGHLRLAAPQWAGERLAALRRATARLPSAAIDGQRWYWPEGESPASRRYEPEDSVRLLAPFDPIVWDRRRFEILWGWAYRFEAYVPASKRVRGYYALPLLWRDQVIGWANAAARDGRLVVHPGYVRGKAPRDARYRAALHDEAARMAAFLGLSDLTLDQPGR
jgi:uncharacterized protein YcaQ